MQQFNSSLSKLEKDIYGKIGIYAMDTNNNQNLSYHADERFPIQSTFKLIAVSALLKKADEDKDILKETAAEKTGGGDGISNDIGIVWSPYCKPIVIAIYTIQNKKNANIRADILASVTSVILKQFSKFNGSFEATAV